MNSKNELGITYVMFFNQLHQVDTQNQIVTTSSWIHLDWIDPRFTLKLHDLILI
jgi:hypothetical protein